MIRRRVFQASGESYDGAEAEKPRCPGEDKCSPFGVAKMETGNGEEACRGCELLPTKGKTVVPSARCVGEGCCSWFMQSAGEGRERKEFDACIGISAEDAKDEEKLSGKKKNPICPYFKSKPTQSAAVVEVETVDVAEVEKLADEIADIVFWEDAGSKTKWKLYPFEYRMLYGIWREAEKQVTQRQNRQMQAFIKSFWVKE